ncbi:tyrosine-type recombinase/integrase [Pirellulaceae bacterium SH449]
MRARVPSYRKHSSGQARVTINGKDYLLGEYGSPSSKREYARLIAEWGAQDNSKSFGVPVPQYTVVELIADYVKFAKGYYGTGPRSEYHRVKPALSVLKRLYGPTPAVQFGPLQYKAVRDVIASEGDRSRTYVNRLCERIVRMLKWAVTEGKLPAAVADAVGMVPGLKKDRTSLRETEEIKPVPMETVEKTLPELSRVVADMVRFQLETGCRPGEVCAIQPGMVDRSNPDVWEIHLHHHKNAWRGKQRTIYVPAKAQAILSRYLLRPADAYCFSPKDANKEVLQDRTLKRVTPLSCGNKPGTNKRSRPKRIPGESYTTGSYGRAISRACERVWPVPKGMRKKADIAQWRKDHTWSPNQLRHTFATKIRKELGIEAASVLLGHSELDTTQIYAQRDKESAIEALRRLAK